MGKVLANPTQVAAIKAYLLSGKSISQLGALNMFGCFRLSAVIWVLRHEHEMNILDEWCEHTSQHGKKRYKSYYLRQVV